MTYNHLGVQNHALVLANRLTLINAIGSITLTFKASYVAGSKRTTFTLSTPVLIRLSSLYRHDGGVSSNKPCIVIS